MGLNIRRCSEPDYVVDIESKEDRECNIGSNKVVGALIDTNKEFEPVCNCQKGYYDLNNPSGVWLEANPLGESLEETVVSHSCVKSQLGDCQNDPLDEARNRRDANRPAESCRSQLETFRRVRSAMNQVNKTSTRKTATQETPRFLRWRTKTPPRQRCLLQ